jgi:hypothetical protein
MLKKSKLDSISKLRIENQNLRKMLKDTIECKKLQETHDEWVDKINNDIARHNHLIRSEGSTYNKVYDGYYKVRV